VNTANDGRAPSGQALAVPVEPVSRLDPSGFDPSRGEEMFRIGLRIGLLAALAVTDSWDRYTRGRISALLEDVGV
jgi:hypothetical protein